MNIYYLIYIKTFFVNENHNKKKSNVYLHTELLLKTQIIYTQF